MSGSSRSRRRASDAGPPRPRSRRPDRRARRWRRCAPDPQPIGRDRPGDAHCGPTARRSHAPWRCRSGDRDRRGGSARPRRGLRPYLRVRAASRRGRRNCVRRRRRAPGRFRPARPQAWRRGARCRACLRGADGATSRGGRQGFDTGPVRARTRHGRPLPDTRRRWSAPRRARCSRRGGGGSSVRRRRRGPDRSRRAGT